MFFSCKVCAEKDKRINDLKERLARLELPSSPDDVSALHLEADGIMSAQQHIIEIPDVLSRVELSAEDERSERDRLLSGTY